MFRAGDIIDVRSIVLKAADNTIQVRALGSSRASTIHFPPGYPWVEKMEDPDNQANITVIEYNLQPGDDVLIRKRGQIIKGVLKSIVDDKMVVHTDEGGLEILERNRVARILDEHDEAVTREAWEDSSGVERQFWDAVGRFNAMAKAREDEHLNEVQKRLEGFEQGDTEVPYDRDDLELNEVTDDDAYQPGDVVDIDPELVR